jgi:glycosyltransferase involved in cell wall biosynthesis
MPDISIIIPLYNKENHIRVTLKSVLAQTFQDFEIIIVNDGSTDDSIKEISLIKDHRIMLFTIENQGVSYARNYGIERAGTDFIAFLDADDYWYPDHLEDLKILSERFPDCGLYAKGFESVYYGKHTIASKFMGMDSPFLGIVKDYFYHSLKSQIVWTSAVAIPTKILKTYGNFDVTLKAGEDTDLWTRIALYEKVAFDSKISAQKIMTDSPNHFSKPIWIITDIL